MRIVFLLFFFLQFLLGADYNGEIYTWGYGELLKNILDAIRALVDGNGLSIIFKTTVGIAFLVFAFKKATDGRVNIVWEFGKMMTLATAVWYLFLNAPNDAKHRYVITDKVTGAQYVVEQIPTGIGEPLQIMSLLEDRIAGAMEKEFSLPNSITYRNSGLGFPLQLQSTMPELKTSDIYFTLTLKDFLENCTLYEIQDGTKNVNDLLTSDDLLAALDPGDDNRLTKVYSASNPDGKVVECKDAYQDIVDNVQNTQLPYIERLAAALLRTSTTLLENKIPDVVQLFFNASKSARDYLQQNFIINMVKGSFKSIAATTGLSESQLAYAAAVAQQSTKDKFITMGFLAKEYLPIAKGILTALIVGLSWIIALVAIIFIDFRYLTKYFFLLLWLVLWTPILVIINYIGDIYAAKVFNQVVNDTGQTITLFTSAFINNKISSTLAWLGYLAWVTPPLAYAIAKGSEYGFVSIASSLSGMATSGAGVGASADVSNAQNPIPRTRVGDVIYTDKPGGIQKEHLFSYGGHSMDEKVVKMGNMEQVGLTSDNGVLNAVASIAPSGIVGINVTSTAASALAQNSIKENLQQQIKAAKQHLEQSAENFVDTISSNISQSINSKGGFSIGSDKSLSLSDRQSETYAVLNSIEKIIGKDTNYSKVLNAMKQASAKEGLAFNVKGLANGGIRIEGIDQKSNKYSLTLTGKDAEAFREQFGKVFAKELMENQSAREAFLKETSHTNQEMYNDISSVSKQYSKSKSDLESLEKVQSLIKSKGISISQNLLNELAIDLIEEFKNKNPRISDKEAFTYAIADISTMIRNGTLGQELEKRGLIDRIVNEESFKNKLEETDANIGNVDKSVAYFTNSTISNVKDDVKARGDYIDKAVDLNNVSFNKLKEKSHLDISKPKHNSSLEKEVKKAEQEINRKLNQSLESNFWEDNSTEIVTAGLFITAPYLYAGGKGIYDWWKKVKNVKPTSIIEGDKIVENAKEALTAVETANTVRTSFSSNSIKAIKAGVGAMAVGLIEGVPLNPTPIADDSLFSGKFGGFIPQEHIFGNDTVGVLVKSGGKVYVLNTQVPYSEMKEYVETHPEAKTILENALKNGIMGSPVNFQDIKTPQELITTMKFNTISSNSIIGNFTNPLTGFPVTSENKTSVRNNNYDDVKIEKKETNFSKPTKPSDLMP